jgi:hypothetical protein
MLARSGMGKRLMGSASVTTWGSFGCVSQIGTMIRRAATLPPQPRPNGPGRRAAYQLLSECSPRILTASTEQG